VIFVINAATPRARITGESAVALSQHGTVAPVTIHHRVDFAASMIDGRTVGEVVPGSASAKEVSDLWLYIQERLSRIVRDPGIAPELKTEHLAVNPMFTEAEAPAEIITPVVMEVVHPDVAAAAAAVHDGPDRRLGIDRRVLVEARAHDRRVFGRRATDHPIWGSK